jgi:hypothetical protein
MDQWLKRDSLIKHGSITKIPSWWCLHFIVVGGLVWSKDPESYASSSIGTGRVSHAGLIEGDDTD